MSAKFLLRSFAGGEISPELTGRLDLAKYQSGLALARNFITLPHGPAARRPGFQFINEAKDSTKKVRLIPFVFSATQSAVIELGHQYIRFHIDGGTLVETGLAITAITKANPGVLSYTGTDPSNGDWMYLSGIGGMTQLNGRWVKVASVNAGANTFQLTDLWGSNINTTSFSTYTSGGTAARAYTISSPYDEADLFDIHYAQSADVITLTHPSYAARELARVSSTSWTLTSISFTAPTGAPSDLSVSSFRDSDTKNQTSQKYVLTTVQDDGVTETLPCDPVSATNNLTQFSNYNTLTWSAVGGADRYNAYKLRGGVYGYIGQTRPVTGSTKSISHITRTLGGGRIVTVTTATAHGFTTGKVVLIESTGDSSLNGAWVITVTSTTVFTYESNLDADADLATGTASIPALSIVDDNVTPDTTQTPPDDIILLNAGSGDYPSATAYHEQRRFFGGTTDKPQTLWGTRTGTEANLTSSVPVRDADAFEVKVASNQYNLIRHLVSLSDLIAFTAAGEFRVFSDGAPAITPTSLSIKSQGYAGAANVQPAVTPSSILYVQAQGSKIRELAFSWESDAYKSIDVSIMAPHRFNGYTLKQLAYSRAPDAILWAVRSDGTLLGMTYVPEQQVYGWHAHDTDGTFESICTVSENNEDVLYAVVKRTINARDVRYIERLKSRVFTAAEDAYFVDAGLTYDSTPTSTLTGLWHLEGESLSILADGAVHPARTVSGGSVTLAAAASVVHAGLGITSDLTTLPLALEGAAASGQGTVKNVNKVHLRLSQSSVVQAGPSFTKLRTYPPRMVSDPYGSPPALRDGEITLSVDPSWNQDAAICVRQDSPLPLTVLSMTLEMQAGG